MVQSQSHPAWQRGFAAGFAGEPLDCCPFAAGTRESWSWVSGYIEGKARRRITTMNDNHERISKLEDRLVALEQRLDTEKAEREALQQIVVPPLTQVRQDLQLHVDFLTERLEAMKARPAGDMNHELVEDIEEVFRGLIQLLKFLDATDERLDWLVGIVTRNMERESEWLSLLSAPARGK
jgi:ribosome modulation factor